MEKILFKQLEVWVTVLIVVVLVLSGWLFSAIAVSTARGSQWYGEFGVLVADAAYLPHSAGKVLKSLIFNKQLVQPKPDIEFYTFDKSQSDPRSYQIPKYVKKDGVRQGLAMVDFTTGERKAFWKTDKLVAAISKFDDTIIVKGERGEQNSTDSLSKVDSDGQVLWTLEIPSHHNVHVDKQGYIYTPIINSDYDGLAARLLKTGRKPYRDDGYAIISPDGKVLETGSATKILLDNGLGHYLFGVGPFEPDAIHMNSVKPAPATTEYYEKGDLLISIRHQSMVFIVRPSTKEIIWYQVGPWTNQHDADFLPDGRVSVFGNDVVSTALDRTAMTSAFINGHNDIYVYDFKTDTTTTPYSQFMQDVDVATVTVGSHKIFPNGDVFANFHNRGIMALYDHETGDIRRYRLEQDGKTDLVNGFALILN